MRKRITLLIAALMLALTMAVPVTAGAALPDNCVKVNGQNADQFPDSNPGDVVCTTVDQPGMSERGAGDPPPGSTDTKETKGNATNKSPEEPQDLEDECVQQPPKSQGNFAC